MRYGLVLALLGICLGTSLFAQTAEQPDLSAVVKRLSALEQRVQQLEQENAALRAQLAPAVPASPPSGAPAAAEEHPQAAAQSASVLKAGDQHEHGGMLQQAA